MQKLIDRVPLQTKPKLHILINGIKRTDTQNVIETDLRTDKKFGEKVFYNKVYDSKVLNIGNESVGFAVDKRSNRRAVLRTELGSVATELSKAIKLS